MRAAWLQRGAAILVTLVTVTACSASSTARLSAASTSLRATPSTAQAPMAMSAFAALKLSHPAVWRQYFMSPSDNLDPQTTGYLTNEPIPAACRGTTPSTVVCGQPVSKMTRGGVYVIVSVLYQQPQPLPQANRTIDGYRTDVVTRNGPGAYGCPAATTRTIAATLSRAAVQPAELWIFACLGGTDIRLTEQQVVLMLESARITARPPATEPVPDAPACSSRDLAVEPGPPFSQMTQERGVQYAVRNIGRRTCRVGGFPRVRLSSETASLPFGYQDGGGPYLSVGSSPVLYLRPGAYASFQVDTTACVTSAGTPATTVQITLPGMITAAALPAQTRTGPGLLDYCGTAGQTVYISALNAY